MKIHNFAESIILGQAGEEKIKEYLHNNLNIIKLEDVSGNTVYRQKDIDFLITCTDGHTYGIELKTDSYDSGNIFYEEWSAIETQSKGCMLKSEADILLYYFVKTQELYIIKLQKYREWFDKNKKCFKQKIIKNKRRNNEGTYTSIGYTIPKTFLKENFKNFRLETVK